MPLIKTKRKEKVVYNNEWIETLNKAKTTVGTWLAAWLAFDWIFGKRRNEISKLIRKDIWTQGQYLYVRFYVGKKRARNALIDQAPYTKKRTLKHPGVKYVLEYLNEYDSHLLTSYPALIREETLTSDGYIFPWNRPRKAELNVHTKFVNRNGEVETKSYSYRRGQGYIDPGLVYYYVKKVNPFFWPQLGRHSVASRAAEDGATEYDICNILDVSARTASKYVHHGTALTERWSRQAD